MSTIDSFFRFIIRLIRMSGISISPDWVSAFGTIAAVVVAIVLSVASLISKWWKKPNFTIDLKSEEPYCRVTELARYNINQQLAKAYWIRLKVTNSGKSVAKKCEGKLTKIINLPAGTERQDFDPIVLHWVGASTDEPIDINMGEYEYLDLIHTVDDLPDNFFIRGVGLTDDLRGINLAPPRVDCYLQVELYGANVKPKKIRIQLKSDPNFSKVKASIVKID